ncbi:conserved hypothetical protein [Candidatus Desulfarcum epimagneticum]|uniref:NAD-dependent epimerase/dehydratase domain-containing protein n=1 Tax=uncultured Desulfobacteraceae bacterium TaxID=218296 RepID=A0A484HGR5_9BACT|nr:conserved hypothetical protein [uncultured Desulfobacteraceae bacterium]
MEMKLIITGATGFIGRNLAERFHKSGAHVTATGRSSRIGAALRRIGADFRPADIRDRSQLKQVFEPADCVIHCAGKTGDWGRYSEFYGTNVTGTRNVIAACKARDIPKIIFLSTPSVYYTGKDRLNISEDEPLPARQFDYGKTKLMAERELLSGEKENLRAISLRPRAVYGPHDETIAPRIFRLSEKKRFPLINHGRALIDITCVQNLGDAVENCLLAPDEAWNEVYNISNGDPVTVLDWFSQMLEMVGRPFNPRNIPEPMAKTLAGMMEWISRLPFGDPRPAMTRFSVGYMARSMTMSIEKARRKIGYSPRISNQRGFEIYREWLKSHTSSSLRP